MKKHRMHNGRYLGNWGGKIYTGAETVKAWPDLPPLKPGQVRCECGASVRLNIKGLLYSHKTLLHQVPCIHSYTEPKEGSCQDIAAT